MYIFSPYPPAYDARPHHNRMVSVVPARPAPSSLPPPSPARPAAPVAEPAATVARATRPPWIEEPGSGEPFNYVNYVALPAIGTTAVILDFTVPEGRNGAIKWIGNNFVGGGWVEGTGAVVWRILRDDGFMKNHENLLGSLGNPDEPSETAPIRIFENERIRLVIDNIAVIVAVQLAGGRLSGWFYPRDEEPEETWL